MYLSHALRIIHLDELPYAAEADPAMLSALQHAWDQFFKDSQTILVICGSQVRTMETLRSRQSPLFGRLTGQWDLEPLPFVALRQFLPGWTLEERVAAYAIVGGVPAYLEWLDPNRSLVDSSGLDPHDLPAMMRHLSQHYSRKKMSWVYATVKTLYGSSS